MPFYHLPHGVPVLEEVARHLLGATHGDPAALSRALVFLPTRRAARALAAAFLRQGQGRGLLLPRMVAVGDLDTNPLFLADAIDLPPSIPALARQAALAAMVARAFPDVPPDRALQLAGDLAALLDEAEEGEIDLSRLPQLAPERFARHWQQTVRFLEIAIAAWPHVLAERGMENPVRRRVMVLHRLAQRLAREATASPVVAIGITAATPSNVALLRAIAALKQGAALLVGLDTTLPEAAWQAIGPTHPQGELRQLLAALELPRQAIAAFPHADPPHAAARRNLFGSAMRPAAALDWETPADPALAEGIALVAAPDSQAEARAIALAVRHALEAPDARIAVITPDRLLAERVAAALARFGVHVEDSAALPLSRTPPGALLRLVAQAVARQFAPVPLLSLLRHPLVAGGMAPEKFRAAGRRFELAALRGPRPGAGVVFSAAALPPKLRADAALRGLQDEVGQALQPLRDLSETPVVAAATLLRATVAAAERLCATDSRPGAERLWSGPEGAALSRHVAACADALGDLPPVAPRWWPDLLDQLLAEASVRARGARGGGEAEAHPRVEILGVLEARLLAHDVVVLAGLNEGTWPATPDPGPWLSRPQRAELGLASPDAEVGFGAADFLAAATAAPRVILSRALKVDGEPTVPSRWLTRILARAGEGALAPAPDFAALAARLDLPAALRKERRPEPVPPLWARPRSLPVTRVERLRQNPYAIYAERVLRLRALDPLDQEADAADWGSLVHDVAKDFVAEWQAAGRPEDPAGAFLRHGENHLAANAARPGLVALWRPRLATLAPWFVEHLEQSGVAARLLEVKGETTFDGPAGDFVLTARADRLDIAEDGSITLLDYKTGQVPSGAAVARGESLQLPLSALIARAGGFPDTAGRQVAALAYVKLSGGPEPGKLLPVVDAQAMDGALALAEGILRGLIAQYDDPGQGYRARSADGDYRHLSRAGAWGVSESDA